MTHPPCSHLQAPRKKKKEEEQRHPTPARQTLGTTSRNTFGVQIPPQVGKTQLEEQNTKLLQAPAESAISCKSLHESTQESTGL